MPSCRRRLPSDAIRFGPASLRNLLAPSDLATARRPSLRGVTWPCLAVAGLSLVCIAAYAGLLVMGRWQTDEYVLFVNQRHWGWHILGPRLTYSPRPFSEGVLFLYGLAVIGLQRPLITSFLAILWGGVLLATLLATFGALAARPGRALAALALAVAPFAFLLVTVPVTELFFWPAASAAYLPTAATAPVLLFVLSRPLTTARRIAAGVTLAVAAGSSEMGAALAIAFAGGAVLAEWGRLLRQGRARRVLDSLWWLVPGLLGLAVMAAIMQLRAGIPELGAGTQPYAGHPAASLAAACADLVREFFAPDGGAAPLSTAGAIAARLLFAAGLSALWRLAAPAGAAPNRWSAVLAVALLGSAYFTIAAAYDHYGALCCERQASTRRAFGDFVIVILAAALWHRAGCVPWIGRRASPWLAAVLLAVSLFPMLLQIAPLRSGYDNRHWAVSGRAQTWQSGLAARTDWMRFSLPPDGPTLPIRGTGVPIGVHDVTPEAPWMVRAMGAYFGKTRIAVCDPWQTDRAWLINGIYFPACPTPAEVPAGSTDHPS